MPYVGRSYLGEMYVGEGEFVAPPAPPERPTLDDAIWNQWIEPHARRFSDSSDRTYFGGIGATGTIRVGAFDHGTGVLTSAAIAAIQTDDHNAPAILVDSSGYIWAFYAEHNTESKVYYRRSSNPEDISSWDAEVELNIGGALVTYVQAFQASSGRMIVFLRLRVGGNNDRWTYRTSTDGGDTWSAPGASWLGHSSWIYMLARQEPASPDMLTVGVHHHPDNAADQDIYLLRVNLDTGDVTAPGSATVIGNLYDNDELPVTYTDGLRVYQAASGEATRLWDINRHGEVVFTRWPSSDTSSAVHCYRKVHMTTGALGAVRELVAAGVMIDDTQQPKGYYAGMAVGESEGEVFLAREDDGTWSVEAWETADEGASWGTTRLETSTESKLARPATVRREGASPRVFWVRMSDYTDIDDYASEIVVGTASPVGGVAVVSAYTNAAGTAIELLFDRPMADPAGDHGAFSFTVDAGSARGFTAAALGDNDSAVVLTIDGAAVETGDVIAVSYDDATGSVAAADTEVLESFEDFPVQNNVGGFVLTTLGIDVVTLEPLPPDAPTIEASPIHGGLLVQLVGEFSSPLGEDETHAGTQYQVANTGDPTFASPVESFELTTEIGLILAQIDTLVGETTYLARARVRGELGGLSLWSNVVEETTLEEIPLPDAPVITVDEIGLDFVAASSSAFSHPDGTVDPEDFDPDDPLPWFLGMRWQVKLASGNWVDDLVYDSLDGPGFEDLEVFISDLDDDTNYHIRGLHFDGFWGAASPWSNIVAFKTEAIPPIRPEKPVIHIDFCGPCAGDGVGVFTDAFAHPEGGATHTATQWRFCLLVASGSSCRSVQRTDAASLLSYELGQLSPGEWEFSARHRDNDNRWSLWSDPEPCSIPEEAPQPEFTLPISGTVIVQGTVINWRMPFEMEAFEGTWEYELQVTPDLGLNWETLVSGTTDESYLFGIGGRPDGWYAFRLRARDSIGNCYGEWAYLFLFIDRTAIRSWAQDFSQLSAIPDDYTVLWNKGQVLWQLVDRNLEPPGANPAYGILARTTQAFAQRTSVLVFEEVGKPDEVDMVVTFALVGRECQGYFWRWAHTHLMNGGLGYRISDHPETSERVGFVATMNSGNQPWPVPYGRCTSEHGNVEAPDACPCQCTHCLICLGGNAALIQEAAAKPWRLHKYAVAWGHSGIHRRALRPTFGDFLNKVSNIPPEGPLVRGANVSRRFPNAADGDNCRWVHYTYTMRVKVDRTLENPNSLRVRGKVFGPGFDPSPEWHFTEQSSLLAAQECGYVGLALSHMQSNLGIQWGVLFRSFAAVDIVYNMCEEPPLEEPPPPEHVSLPCIIARHYFLGRSDSDRLERMEDVHTDDETPIVSRAVTRELAPYGVGSDAVFTNVYFTLSAYTTGTVVLTPIINGVRKENASRTIEFESDGLEEFTRRYELALYEHVDGEGFGGGDAGRRALRGTFFRLEIEVVDTEGVGRVEVGGFELETVQATLRHPHQYFVDENAVERDLPGVDRKMMWGLKLDDRFMEYTGKADLDTDDSIQLLALSRPAAPGGPGGEAIYTQLSIPVYRSNTQTAEIVFTPIVDGVAYPVHTMPMEGVDHPVREVYHLDLYRPVLDDEGAEVGRAALRGAWWQLKIESVNGIPDGLFRIGRVELEAEVTIESEVEL